MHWLSQRHFVILNMLDFSLLEDKMAFLTLLQKENCSSSYYIYASKVSVFITQEGFLKVINSFSCISQKVDDGIFGIDEMKTATEDIKKLWPIQEAIMVALMLCSWEDS